MPSTSTPFRRFLTSSLLLLAVACTPPADDPATETTVATGDETLAAPTALDLPSTIADAEAVITADLLHRQVAELSDDAFAGRLPGSPGDLAARRWIAEQMAAIGLEPAGDAGPAGPTWEQPFEIVSLTTEAPETWSFAAKGEHVDLAWSDDYIAWIGRQQEAAALDGAELVFVGYGIQAPEYDWDDYRGIDLKGKVVVLLNNDPDWDPELFEGERRLYYGRWDYKYEKAAERGAAGAILIHTTPSAGYPWQVIQTSWTGAQLELPDRGEPRLEIAAWATEEAMRRVLAAAGHDLDALVEGAKSGEADPVPLGVTTSLAVRAAMRRTETANVLGRLPGSDPRLANEIVLYTAHHDHLGVGSADGDGDAIYNGALDNAAGVAQVLAIARAMRSLPEPPRRSVLFALVAAEEQGLLGSEYLAAHPPAAPGRIAANLNFDGGNIWGRTRDVVFIGYGKSSLDAVVEAAAARQDRVVVGDQFPDRGFFYRSDQFNLAKIGVPAIYLDTGTDFRDREPGWGREQIEAWEAACYHQPCDELEESWVWEGMLEDARLGLVCGVAIADASAAPSWHPGDEFEAVRKAAREAIDP